MKVIDELAFKLAREAAQKGREIEQLAHKLLKAQQKQEEGKSMIKDGLFQPLRIIYHKNS